MDVAGRTSPEGVVAEWVVKHERIRTLLEARGLDGLVLRKVSSFAWATGGVSSAVNVASDFGVAQLFITRDKRMLLTNTIEAPRFEREHRLAEQGWELVVSPWHEPAQLPWDAGRSLELGSDSAQGGMVDCTHDMARLRSDLLPVEVERARALGQSAARAMDDTIRAVRPGDAELGIAGRLACQTLDHGAWPIVMLVATDERVELYRHPVPTHKQLDRYAMIVLCARANGLVCSLTRLVHFGRLPDALRRKHEAVVDIDATFLHATRPGARLADVFAAGVARYGAVGHATEWTRHHQGGTAGYEPREHVATPASTWVVRENEMYAWNPSLAGTKSEDTIVVTERGHEVVTSMDGWPMLRSSIGGIDRPAILES
jgi:antitoxin VapB